MECIEGGLETYEQLFKAAKAKAGEGDDVAPRIWLGVLRAPDPTLPLAGCALPL